VALLDLERNDPQRKASMLGKQHRRYVCDVTQRKACQQVAERIIEDFGAVDILINNAGITQPIRILDVKPVNYDAVLNVNLRGMLYLSQSFMPHMISRGQGLIACNSSVSGQAWGGVFHGPHYSAAKAGRLGLANRKLARLIP
jgi:NAD(P)-dependent dehydrogenase (short-subunit alcohol dehydrogenase family)